MFENLLKKKVWKTSRIKSLKNVKKKKKKVWKMSEKNVWRKVWKTSEKKMSEKKSEKRPSLKNVRKKNIWKMSEKLLKKKVRKTSRIKSLKNVRKKNLKNVKKKSLKNVWSQLRWFGHLVRKPPGTPGRPRTRWRDYISTLAWERLGIPQSELVNVAREREVWGPLLELLPPRPDPG